MDNTGIRGLSGFTPGQIKESLNSIYDDAENNPYVDISYGIRGLDGTTPKVITAKPGMEKLATNWHEYNQLKTNPPFIDSKYTEVAKVLYNALKKYQFRSLGEINRQGDIYSNYLDRSKDEDRIENFKENVIYNIDKIYGKKNVIEYVLDSDLGKNDSDINKLFPGVRTYVEKLIEMENKMYELKQRGIKQGQFKPKDVFNEKQLLQLNLK